MAPVAHAETHRTQRVGWLRAAVLGANDGVVSTASLIIGVAASDAAHTPVVTSGLAGLVAGAMSMAAGEYVSVSSQADTERADISRERQELHDDPLRELDELTAIYVGRGLEEQLARQVAEQLTSRDALAAHARDELGLTDTMSPRPVQAAVTSAITFAAGAAVPLGMAVPTRDGWLIVAVALTALLVLTALGALGAVAGGAPITRAVTRVVLWGALAMLFTAGVGATFGAIV
ncbi:MAG: VIT family protein [Acidimicrobiia bacterium]|nr:VIT family protein [Acidimicrobiia bacterium]